MHFEHAFINMNEFIEKILRHVTDLEYSTNRLPQLILIKKIELLTWDFTIKMVLVH